MDASPEGRPEDVAALKEALVVAPRESVPKMQPDCRAETAIARMEHQIYGQRSKRFFASDRFNWRSHSKSSRQVPRKMKLAAEKAVAKVTSLRGIYAPASERNTFPDHLPPRARRDRSADSVCCCGGNRLRKLGEDVTCTLESIPRQWKVIETVRENLPPDCEKISQAPAPSMSSREMGGPSLLP